MKHEHILIIKHGALGDIILATGPLKAIRQQHPAAHITLLTTKSFASLLKDCPFVDEVRIDPKKLKATWNELRRHRFTWVYDLQTSQRSTWYYHLLPFPKPRISSLSRFASHRHHTPERTKLHTIDRQKQQLAIAGITDVPAPDIRWLKSDISPFALPEKYALLVPGGSAHRPEKRWPGGHYAELARWLSTQGITPVLIGAGAEEGLLKEIETLTHMVGENSNPSEPSAASIAQASGAEQGQLKTLNLCNKTTYADIAELARHATYAIGNDTGPMHIIAATGCTSLVLFSHASNPDLCAPRGEQVGIFRVENLSQLPVESVTERLNALQMLDSE